MQTFNFLVVATGLDPEADDFEDRFFEAGCDDATLSFQKGLILVAFDREADSLEEAVVSAVLEVLRAGATVRRVEPDELVSQADIGRRADLTRAAISNYIAGTRGDNFPLPVAKIATDNPLWRWSEVAHWLHAFDRLDAEEAAKAVLIGRINDLIAHCDADVLCHALEDMMPVTTHSPPSRRPVVG